LFVRGQTDSLGALRNLHYNSITKYAVYINWAGVDRESEFCVWKRVAKQKRVVSQAADCQVLLC
jgi:hypothetical protein